MAFEMAAILWQSRMLLLLVATLTSQSLAQDENNCELITESELGSTTTHSQDGIVPTALATDSGSNPDRPVILIRGYRVTCSVAGTAPDTYQYLSVVVSFSCADHVGLTCSSVSNHLSGEGNFTTQFELRCTSSKTWGLGNDFSSSASATISNPANGNLVTAYNKRCALCLSNGERTRRLFPSVVYNTESHCAFCHASCLSEGSGQCTNLGPGDCCPFYVYNNAESGFMCVDECPNRTLPNNNSLCLGLLCPKLVDPDQGVVLYKQCGPVVYFAATYVCNDGYYLGNGDRMRMCQSNGTWSGTEPTCNELCSALDSIGNGRVTYSQDDVMNRTVATYECNATYTLVGNEKRTCPSWSGLAPTCVAVLQESAVTDVSSTTVSYSPTVSPQPSCSSAWPVAGTIIAVTVFLGVLVIAALITTICLQQRTLRTLRQEIERNRSEVPMAECAAYGEVKVQSPIYEST